jgi:hypothetical protein
VGDGGASESAAGNHYKMHHCHPWPRETVIVAGVFKEALTCLL